MGMKARAVKAHMNCTTREQLPSWGRRGGAKRRGGRQVEKFPMTTATTPRGIRFAIPLASYPRKAVLSFQFIQSFCDRTCTGQNLEVFL
jgi:hypothetical protein